MLFWQAEQKGAKILQRAGSESPALCSRVLLQFAAGINRAKLILFHNEIIPDSVLTSFFSLVQKRTEGVPLAYLVGRKEFYGRDFFVNKFTLVPRPETELIVDLALKLCVTENCLFLDACCGSGCIGLTLMLEKPLWNGYLIDNSWGCVNCVKQNAAFYGLNPGVIQGDIFFPFFSDTIFDLIVCNPPYISISDKKNVMDSVLKFEPHSALFSKNKGFEHIIKIIAFAKSILKNKGIIIIEHGDRQQEEASEILEKNNFEIISLEKDLSGKPRVITARFNSD